jgi:RNA polymerase sigma-70 factor (ECF subfamily)
VGVSAVSAQRIAMDDTSASLLRRLRQPGDARAWERFVDLYTPLLYFWACRMGLQASDASDLVQDVFAGLLQKLPTFEHDPNRSFRAWLRTVTLNRWRDHCRRKAAAMRGGTDAGLDEVAVPDPAQAVWETEYRQHVLRQALELMKAEFQELTWKAFCGLVVDGKSAAAVAAELKLTPAAVYSAKARVLRRLRQEFDGLLD